MSEDKKPDSPPAPKTQTYELPAGAIAILDELLPRGEWYKDEKKPAMLLTKAASAVEALPELPARPRPMDKEDRDEFGKRIDEWATSTLHKFEWTEKQRDAAKVCVNFYLKKGDLLVNPSSVAIIQLLGIDDE